MPYKAALHLDKFKLSLYNWHSFKDLLLVEDFPLHANGIHYDPESPGHVGIIEPDAKLIAVCQWVPIEGYRVRVKREYFTISFHLNRFHPAGNISVIFALAGVNGDDDGRLIDRASETSARL